jgi:hypothetical protein
MLSKISTALICLIAVGCMPKQQDMVAVKYDEQALKTLVLDVFKNNNADHKLDSAIAFAAKDSSVFVKTISFLEKPFGDPNSRYRRESFYVKLLQEKIKSPWVGGVAVRKTRERLYLLMQNNVGTAANDFMYTTPAGERKKMYDLHTGFTLLYFYNPECDACKQMRTTLAGSDIIKSKVKRGKLQVLAVYTDKQERLWRDHLPEMPAEWIQGRDEYGLYKNNVYDLRAIPSLYLLDKDKKVLLKDCTDLKEIEKSLKN